jgi:hypothetical protein
MCATKENLLSCIKCNVKFTLHKKEGNLKVNILETNNIISLKLKTVKSSSFGKRVKQGQEVDAEGVLAETYSLI